MSTAKAVAAKTTCPCCSTWKGSLQSKCKRIPSAMVYRGEGCECCQQMNRFWYEGMVCPRAYATEKKQRREEGYVPVCGDCSIGICTQNPNTCPFVQEQFGPQERWPRARTFKVVNDRWVLID